jgi:hypothetical protein
VRMPPADEDQVLLYRPALLHRRHYAQSGPATVVCAPGCEKLLTQAIFEVYRRDAEARSSAHCHAPDRV